MAFLNSFIDNLNGYLYSYILIALLLGGGVFFTLVAKFTQFSKIKEGIHLLFEKKHDGNSISGFQALMVSTASRVGVGNIAGVATAIALGGSGAVFWMWVTALLGGATACAESTLAQVYKIKSQDGSFTGGPSYYITKALKSRALGVIFAVSLIATFAYGYEFLQANLIIGALERYTNSNQYAPYVIGLIMAAITSYAVFGGQKSVAKITEKLVPIMAVIYLIFCIIIIFRNIGNLPTVFRDIFANAFDFKTIFAGFLGSAVMQGIRRGLYSNEAGMGSAPNAAATVATSHPVKQGYVQMIAVYIDTIIICTATALMVLSTGVSTEGVSALPLVQRAVESQFGEAGVIILTFAVFMFAFSTIIGNYFYTECNILYILKRPSNFIIFRWTVVVGIFVGCVMDTSLAWNIADLLQGIMALINVPVLIILVKQYLRVLNDYNEQRKAGKEPVFMAKNCGIENTDYWKESDLQEVQALAK